ncbi:MAG: Hsp70 family protein [Deltaproteobacteria bacterium]|nr:Hsp70 family protein [Deltaproteobacteria bacterium]
MTDLEKARQALCALRDGSALDEPVRGAIMKAVRQLPKDADALALFTLALELLEKIHDPADKRVAILDYMKELPKTDPFLPLYANAVEEAITAADALDEHHYRTTELLKLANEMPRTAEFVHSRLRAWRLALGLADKPRLKDRAIELVAKDLPKASDEDFYRRYTLLGIMKGMPKDGVFLDLYRQGVARAMEAVGRLTEPYYRKYAMLHMAEELKTVDGCADLRLEAMKGAYKAAADTTDPFAREYALLEMIQVLPKTREFFPILKDAVEQSLAFFTVKKWMGDVEVLDVVDFILSAEELGMKESKQKRFSREKYAATLANEIEKFGLKLHDTRFIEALKPYTHVWVQPKGLRDAVKKVVDHLASLEKTYHGREIGRPVFVKERNPFGQGSYIQRKVERAGDTIAIDLGATNTVIMRSRATGKGVDPEFLQLPVISRRYSDGTLVVPSVLSAETNKIGAEVNEENPIANMKQMLLEGSPRGREYMERFLKLLSQHLKKATAAGGWFSFGAKIVADTVYITVPIGYMDYKAALSSIAGRHMKGAKVEFIEEPLAAAVGYQVVEERDKVVALIDFGGSTLNTMVLRLNVKEVHVVSKPERAQLLGGHDIDIWLARHLAGMIGLEAENLPYRLIRKAEEIKIALSEKDDVPFEWEGAEVARVTRAGLEEVLERNEFFKFIDRTVSYVLRRAEKVGVKKDRIEAVLLTGGSSQIPSFKAKIGDLFPRLRRENAIYDHSPLSAVASGAAIYSTKDITDRHLGMAYAVRYAPEGKDETHSFCIVLEKGETLPLEKTFSVSPARKLGEQDEMTLEIFEVPEGLIARRWAIEGGIEFLKQDIRETAGLGLEGMKTVSLPFNGTIPDTTEITLLVDEGGRLSVVYGPENKAIETGIRLQ